MRPSWMLNLVALCGCVSGTGDDSASSGVKHADAGSARLGTGTGTGTDFVGTIMADQSITVGTAATVAGRLLARIGAVTLDTNTVAIP